jgi:hypothetical protein
MKKKFRELTIGDKKYGWTLRNNCDGDGGNGVEIWWNKKIIHHELISGYINITPKLISNIIIEYLNERLYLIQYSRYLINIINKNDIYTGSIYSVLLIYQNIDDDVKNSRTELTKIGKLMSSFIKESDIKLNIKTYDEFKKIVSRKEKIESLYDLRCDPTIKF